MIETFRKLFAFCSETNRKLFIHSIWLSFISAICNALRIPAVYIVIQGLLNQNLSMRTLWISFAIIFISLVITIRINMTVTMMQTKAGYRECANKRIEIAEHLRYLPMGWFNQNSLGEVTSVTTNTLEAMSNVATRVVLLTTKGYLATLFIGLMMLVFDWRIGCITFIGIAIYLVINAFMQKAEKGVSIRKSKADEKLVTKVLEFVQGITEIKNYDMIETTNSEVNDAIEQSSRANFGMEIPSVIFIFFQNIATKLTGVAISIATLLFYLDGSMVLADCIVLLICAYIIYEQLDSAGNFSPLFRLISISVDKVNAILQTEPMDIDGRAIVPSQHNIQLNHVDFSYDQKQIIHDITLSIPEKSTVAIVGPSGSGKTTLCHLMARFWDVNSGEVSLGGDNVKDYNYDDLMKNFSFVFQRTYLFSDTIANNIRFGQADASMDRVIEAAKKARCHDFIMALPDGYDTVINEGGASLSGGERQRITIARAIMKDAPIIILDEATANVDPENERDLIDAIDELTKEKTIVMIAHRLKTVRNADQIIVLDQGRIVQQGTHEELMAQEGIYKNFVSEREQAVSWKIQAI